MPWDPTAIRRQTQGSKKSPLSDGDSAEATDTIMNGASETHPWERKRSPDANLSKDLSTRKRRLESQDQDRGRFYGTFCKHSLKHLPQGRSPRQAHRERRNDNGERKRGGEVLKGNKVTVPKNGHACKTLQPLPATASAEAGQPLKLKEEQPNGKSHSSSLSIILGVTTTSKLKGKREPSSRATSPSIYLARRRYRARRTTQRRSSAQSQEPKTPPTPMKPKFLSEKNTDGEGCDEQERQR